MKKYLFILPILAVLIVLVVFVLNSKKNTAKYNTPKQKVVILLDWFPNTNHTGLYIAKNQGFFDKEGLDVSILEPAEGENTQVVASGKADFGISSQESVTLARSEGIPIISIAAIIQHNTSAFASLSDSNIKSVADFEGKRYGGWGSAIEEAVLKAVMDEAKADYKKVKNITIGETDFFKSIGRDSDFQWIFYGWDAIEAKRRGISLNTIMLKDLNPVLDYYTPVIITNEEHIRNKKELVSKFMKAVRQGYEYAIENPNAASEILIKQAPELNRELVRKSQEYLSPEYKASADKWGLQKEEVWKRYSNWLYEHKLLKENINVQNAFTNEFLND